MCSQISFYVTRARKYDKKDKTRFFFAKKKDELDTQQTIGTQGAISINQILKERNV